MDWLTSNWIWLALGGGAIALFAFGRGGCGMGHGGHVHRRRDEGEQHDPRHETTVAPLATHASGVDAAAGTSPSTSHVHDVPSVNQGALAAEHAGHDSGPSQAQRQPHRHGC